LQLLQCGLLYGLWIVRIVDCMEERVEECNIVIEKLEQVSGVFYIE